MEDFSDLVRSVPPAAKVPHLQGVRDLKRARRDLNAELISQNTPPKQRRAEITQLMLSRMAEHWEQVTQGKVRGGIVLGAVGGLGRGDSGPASDLDLVLIHDGKALTNEQLAELAQRLWYPIWDAGLELDYSSRSLSECRQVASKDLAAAAGLLDLHAVAGDFALAQKARSLILQDWRSAARKRLPELLAASRGRAERNGELAYLIEPNLKESRGGLRDYTSLTALSATWLVDRPRGAVDAAGEHLLNVRDAIQTVTGRPVYVLGRHIADDVAAAMHLSDADELLASLAEAGRTIAYAVETTERGARRSLEKSGHGSRAFLARRRATPPRHLEVAPGLIDVDGELALGPGVDASNDALLPLRAAAVAATTGLSFNPLLLESLTTSPPLTEPWPAQAREYFRDLLRGAHHLVGVWEALDVHGLSVRWLPEWTAVRNRPQRSPLHRFTVDRHQIEAVVQAGRLRRNVPNPDLLLMAALLHDIGKGHATVTHPAEGALLIPTIGERMGLSTSFSDDLALLVAEHLTLAELATQSDPHDPDTVRSLVDRVNGRRDLLDTLRVLTEADATAAGPKAWSNWRATLIEGLYQRAAMLLPAA